MIENILAKGSRAMYGTLASSSHIHTGEDHVAGTDHNSNYGTATSTTTRTPDMNRPLESNPGTEEFAEGNLHEAHLTVWEQVRVAFRDLRPIKLLFLLLLPLVLLVALTSTHKWQHSSSAAATTVDVLPAVPNTYTLGYGVVQTMVFVLALLCTIPCATLTVELLEDIVVRRDDETLGVLVNVFAEHAAEVLFALFALLASEVDGFAPYKMINLVLLGAVLFHLLVVLGGSILAAPVLRPQMMQADQSLTAFGLSTWSTFGQGLIFATAVVLLPTVYALTITRPQSEEAIYRKHIAPAAARADEARHLLIVSRGLAMFVLLVYTLYVVRTLRSNTSYFASADTPNAPSSLSYAVQYRAKAHAPLTTMSWAGPRFGTLFACTGVLFLLTLQAWLCYLLVHTLPLAASTTSLPLPFLGVVVLPAVFECGGFGAALLMSREGRLDISASIAFSSVVHLFLCLLPCIVLLAWLLQVPLEIAFHPFLACSCFIAVLVVSQMVVLNRVRWLEGAILLAVYGIVACICLLGGWHMSQS